jgi:hypothetical protein
MGICQDHPEFVSVGDSVNHVSNCASDGTENGVSLFLLKPHSEFDGGSSLFTGFLDHLEGDVFERFGEAAQFALDGDNS